MVNIVTSVMNGYLLSVLFCVTLNYGICKAVIISDCDSSCGLCTDDVCVECASYYYTQSVPPPVTEAEPSTSNPFQVSENDTNVTSTTPTTTATTTTSIITTAAPITEIETTTVTAPPEQTFRCVPQCYPGYYGFNGTCYECLVERCSLCAVNETRCLVCENGWYLQGDSCTQFSPVEISLIALTCIFGAVVLVVFLVGVVFCARNGFCDTCCASLGACLGACQCKSCQCRNCCRKTRTRSPSVVPPSLEEVFKPVPPTKGDKERYTRDPSNRRKESSYVQEPQYPLSYTTQIMEDENYATPINEETYDEVEVQEGPIHKESKKLKKTSEKPKPAKKPKRSLKQEQNITTDVQPFQQDEQQEPKPKDFKEMQPLPSNDQVYYNNVPEPESENEYGEIEPVYENVAETAIPGQSGANEVGSDEPYYGNLPHHDDPTGVRRPTAGRRNDGKRDSRC